MKNSIQERGNSRLGRRLNRRTQSIAKRSNKRRGLKTESVHFAAGTNSAEISIVLAPRRWLKSTLIWAHAYLKRMGLSNLIPGRTRWGPPWQWLLFEHECSNHKFSTDSFGEEQVWISSADKASQNAPNDGSRKIIGDEFRNGSLRTPGMAQRRDLPLVNKTGKRLRSPRSETTRALCLLNRMRAHLHINDEFDEGSNTMSTRHTDTPSGSISNLGGVRQQRWVGVAPFGVRKNRSQRIEQRSASLTPVREGVSIW